MSTAASQPKAAVVTGASSGLGAALADHLFAQGWSVLGIANDMVVDDQIGATGNIRWSCQADLSADPCAHGLLDEFAKRCGRLDGLVNNAAVQHLGTVEELSSTAWRDSLAVNLTAPLCLSRAAIPHMRSAGGGVILNVSSVHASATGPRRVAYAATKAGLVGLTKALAIDHGHENIRAIALSPGPFATQKLAEGIANLYPEASGNKDLDRYSARIPLARVGTLAEFAAFAASLLGDTATFVTGSEIVLDGGLTARLAVGD